MARSPPACSNPSVSKIKGELINFALWLKREALRGFYDSKETEPLKASDEV